MTSDTGPEVKFMVHRANAKKFFYEHEVLLPSSFYEVAWPYVHATLHSVPRMFQIWACKKVMGVAGTFHFPSKYNSEVDPKCPSCRQSDETVEHVLHCP